MTMRFCLTNFCFIYLFLVSSLSSDRIDDTTSEIEMELLSLKRIILFLNQGKTMVHNFPRNLTFFQFDRLKIIPF